MSEWGEFARLCDELEKDAVRGKCRKCDYKGRCVPEICDAGEYDD